MNKMMMKAIFHSISTEGQDTLVVHGFDGFLDDGCFSLVADGHHYFEYGIADNSVLIASMAAKPHDGDIVIHFDGALPVLYLFQPDSKAECDGRKRMLHDVSQVDAVILGSFNFYR